MESGDNGAVVGAEAWAGKFRDLAENLRESRKNVRPGGRLSEGNVEDILTASAVQVEEPGRGETRPIMVPPTGCGEYRADSAARVVTIDLHAIYGKEDIPWLAALCSGSTERNIRRELFRDRSVPSGLPVYETFDTAAHLAKDLELVRGSRYIGGWDAGQTQNFAFVLFQITPAAQVQSIFELTAFNANIDGFCQDVQAILSKRFPKIVHDIDHVGDSAINTRDAFGKNVLRAMRDYGFKVRPMSNKWSARHSAASMLLEDWIGEDIPRFVIDPAWCPVLLKALQGAYRYEEKTARKSMVGLISRYNTRPEKDEFSHIADAYQYAAMRAWEFLERYYHVKRGGSER